MELGGDEESKQQLVLLIDGPANGAIQQSGELSDQLFDSFRSVGLLEPASRETLHINALEPFQRVLVHWVEH